LRNYNQTPLHLAARHDKTEAIISLIQHRADINPLDDNKWTPLRFATHRKQQFGENPKFDAVEYIIEHGGIEHNPVSS